MRRSACFIASATWLLCGMPAHAALGGALSSIEEDRSHFSARMLSVTHDTHAVHSLTLANGVAVREFTTPDGAVFAVAWQGPARPDLRQLLGSHFDTLQADNAATPQRRRHTPLAVDRTDLIVRSGGHSGAFWGVAYLPQSVPSGFSVDDLQMDKTP